MKKKLLKVFFVLLALSGAGTIWFVVVVTVTPPEPKNLDVLSLERECINPGQYAIGPNWIRQTESGLWEMYLEGAPFERGVINGKLCLELAWKQEDAFVGQIKKIVPSDIYLNFLKYFVAWFNRNLDESVPQEYRLEIFGVSRTASDKYDYIAPKYHRILNYHAAHDIGHALQDKNMVVGCTSFSTWGKGSADSSLLVARNFDFYVGDAFAENKVVFFIKPDSGYKFISIAWGGMVGVVSGMNDQGLTVTMNAGKSDVPSGASTPISIVAREILQYASTIDEAFKLAKKHKTFVSESLMIGSAKDGRTAIIEKSPVKIGVYSVNDSQDRILCSNHFQSDIFANDELNLKNIAETDSKYRYERLSQLLDGTGAVDILEAAQILRDRNGLNNADLGMGSQLAINQLNGHHSVIFKPSELKVWVSTPPWQLGAFQEYDLKKVFAQAPYLRSVAPLHEIESGIPVDSFRFSTEYVNYLQFRRLKSDIHDCLAKEKKCSLPESVTSQIVASNPHLWYAYELAGDYFELRGEMEKAAKAYQDALTKAIPTLAETKRVENKLSNCLNK